MSFVRAANPIWLFVDLEGNILDDRYYISFLTNTLPYLPQAVYRDNQGLVPWNNPLEFEANGTLPDNLYFNEDLVYRLEVRDGPTQDDNLIYEVNNFVPGPGSGPDTTSSGTEDNQITNPQFAFISFVSPLTISAAGTYEVAPGWFLALTGSGTATVSQVISAGDQDLESNRVPPYALELNLNGWTTAILYQRFSGNGAIWVNTFVSMSVLARSNDGIARALTLVYMPNTPGTPATIATGVLSTSAYEIIQGVIPLPESTNTTLSDEAYVDMQIVLPGTGDVQISNIQVMGQTELLPNDFAQTPVETIERQTDHLFHYYKHSILIQPKDSLLVGWNFGLNPWQFRSTVGANVATNQYTADQTIVIQQAYVASATGNNVSVGQGSLAFNYSLGVVSVTANNQFAILQYIDPRSIRSYWSNTLSALVKAQVINGTREIQFKMRLIYIAGLPSATSQVYPISSWTAGQTPTFAAGVTAIAPLNDPTYTFPISNTQLTSGNEFAFEGFQLPVSSNVNMTLGVLLYTVTNMDQAVSQTIEINDISLVPNAFAIASNPKTSDQVLRQCQYYYLKTFPQGTVPVNAGGKNGALAYNAFEAGATSGEYMWRFPVVMRATPSTFTAYNPVSNNTTWYNNTQAADSGASSFSLASDASVYVGNAQVGGDIIGDAMLLNATADARLG